MIFDVCKHVHNPSFWSTHPGPIAFQEVPQAPLYAQCAEERTKGQW